MKLFLKASFSIMETEKRSLKKKFKFCMLKLIACFQEYKSNFNYLYRNERNFLISTRQNCLQLVYILFQREWFYFLLKLRINLN